MYCLVAVVERAVAAAAAAAAVVAAAVAAWLDEQIRPLADSVHYKYSLAYLLERLSTVPGVIYAVSGNCVV